MKEPKIELVDKFDLDNTIDLAWNSTRGTKVPVSDLLKSPLQFRNLPQFLFRMTTSIRFRDFLTAIDEINIWSETGRKTKNLGLTKIDYDRYHTSIEYGKKSRVLMDAYIDDYNRQVDLGVEEIDRALLPMSSLTTYYVSMNFNQLVEIIKYIDTKLPIFSIYSDLLYSLFLDYDLRKYGIITQMTKSLEYDNSLEGASVTSLGNYSKFTFECSYSIYAQVARHKGIKVYGYYNDLLNKPYDVLYGDTIKVTLVGPTTTIDDIINTRICCFSQSSGTGLNSWYPIIRQWLGKDITLTDLVKRVPCKGCCASCPFHDDMSNREIDCPIKKHEDGSKLKTKFNNPLGDAYYALQSKRKCNQCEYLLDSKYKECYSYYRSIWTSDFRLYVFNESHEVAIDNLIDNVVKEVENNITIKDNKVVALSKDYESLVCTIIPKDELTKFINWNNGTDYTGITKGLFMHKLANKLVSSGVNSFYINHGGDIYYYEVPRIHIDIANTDFDISTIGTGCVFTSSNYNRPNHIPDSKYGQCVVFGSIDPIEADYLATTCLVNGLGNHKDKVILFDKDNRVIHNTYVASPFFNDLECNFRDKMVLKFLSTLRPDLVNPNIEGDLNKDKDLANKIIEDNLRGIDNSNYLVFPKFTTDMGTLMEVGYAISRGMIVISYDGNKYTIHKELSGDYSNELLDLSKVGNAIKLGITYGITGIANYFLNTCTDNIMLWKSNRIDDLDNTNLLIYPKFYPHLLGKESYKAITMTSAS